MGNVLTGLERWSRRQLAWVLPVMFLLPAAMALAANGLARLLGGGATQPAQFEPSGPVVHASVVLGLVYAVVFMVLMNRLRRAMPPLPAGRKPQRGDITVGSVWGMGLGLWAWTSVLGMLFVCGAINQMVGTATTEPARIFIKRIKQGKGCHREIGVVSAVVPDGRNVCVAPADWDRLEEGDSVPVLAVVSGLGRAVGLAPGALSHVTKRAP